jgi:signal transduction histidine kinase
MAGRTHDLLAVLLRVEPRKEPSGWALAVDAVLGMAAAAGAVAEMAHRSMTSFQYVNGVLIASHTTHVDTSLPLYIVAALTGLPLAARRLYPITALLAITVAILLLPGAGAPAAAMGAAVLAAYSAVAHSRYRNLAVVVVMSVALMVSLVFAATITFRFPERMTALLAMLPTAGAAFGIRESRKRLRESNARHAEATRRAIEAERARIASELHDVVTHNVSVMLVQAGAARSVLASSPGDATDALLAVEASGRTAMTELRSLLGLLSPSADGDAVLDPQPGLRELAELIRRVREAGLPVELRVTGTPRPLSPGKDLAAYRVVQEALTNVLRHAGKMETVVMVEWGEQLVITVSDAGRGAGAGESGRGLAGLRERLAVYGGTLDAGPRPEAGGWRVRAVLPA